MTDAVFAFRHGRAKALAAQGGLDVIITSLPENTRYFSGFYPAAMDIAYAAECYLVLHAASGAMALVASAADVPTILEGGFSGSIYPLGVFQFCTPGNDAFTGRVKEILATRLPSAAAALHAAIGQLCPGAKTVAVDEARCPPTTWLALAEALQKDGAALTSANAMLHRVKSVKHPEEIAMLRRSANIAENALMEMIAEIRPGASETEMAEIYRQKVAAQGANPFFCVATANVRAAFSDTVNRPFSKVEDGTVVRYDFGCILEGFHSDLSRTAVAGQNPKAEAYYAAVRAGEEAAVAAIKPGVAASEVFHIAQETVQKTGIPHYSRHHVGHGIGVSTYDWPSIAPDSDAVLEEDMVLCIETPYYEIGWGGVQVEDAIVITATGAEYLTETSRALARIKL
ncbi:Xaa-Pro peptidase family protein [Clostridia bacterium OttesenSCG-928-O13]|nr:Xaa-Pro peptidase family protein [Clostridia bacterium OttesenSCG-928-O13]